MRWLRQIIRELNEIHVNLPKIVLPLTRCREVTLQATGSEIEALSLSAQFIAHDARSQIATPLARLTHNYKEIARVSKYLCFVLFLFGYNDMDLGRGQEP